MMTTQEIREKYLRFFEKRGHAIVPSSSLVPENDPTTLFTGSGMQPMVPYLLGERHSLGARLTDSQKCFRSQDIEEVGDNRHTTFFEMLGNWSFGDYFKREQIAWMWEFLTEELGLDPARLSFTCHGGNAQLGIPRDEEAAYIWKELLEQSGVSVSIIDNAEEHGLQEGRIFYYGDKKNWWSRVGAPENMPTGEPGGPDTEMFWDFGEQLHLHEASLWKDMPCHVNCDCGRFVEIGNNVFMEYVKTDSGFQKLPKPNVDFGGGLERMAAAVNDNPDVFLIDIFDGARSILEKLSGKRYGEDEKDTYAFRVILDHVRAATFLIADGVVPSNKDQGYFVRRLIRRAVRFAKNIGICESFVKDVAAAYVETYGESYVALKEKQEMILRECEQEEQKFRRTLEQGMKELEKRSAEGSISGKDAFELFSTYGFPLEMTQEMLEERGLKVDEVEFRKEFKRHQDLSRTASAGKFKGGLADTSEKTTKLHTATHLMLAGLRKFLGDGVHQAGSNITEERARFDFTYPEKVSREVLDQVEVYVNEAIRAKCTVGTDIMDKEAARAAGVEGSFWEKYPERVTVYRVKSVGGTVYSAELCGGPHVGNTSDMGHFRIIKEEASSAGVRRVKAILEDAV
ncbi:MAG: alanine--tRNA ligase [Candidatus Moraniibacteriota bacterium]